MLFQEHWLPYFDVNNQLASDFTKYDFHSTSSDMYLNPEDITINHAWQGTAIGWLKTYSCYISKIPLISQWFCGIKFSYQDKMFLVYSVYLPTSGKDEEFCEVIQTLSEDISSNMTGELNLILGMDSNQSEKSTSRRTYEMPNF